MSHGTPIWGSPSSKQGRNGANTSELSPPALSKPPESWTSREKSLRRKLPSAASSPKLLCSNAAIQWDRRSGVGNSWKRGRGGSGPSPKAGHQPQTAQGGPARNLSPQLCAPALVLLGGEVNSPAGMLSQEAPAPNVLLKCGTW